MASQFKKVIRLAVGLCGLIAPLCPGLAVAEPPYGVEALLAGIAAEHVDSVERALALLPQELRKNYVLVFSSRSLQEATPAEPRAILFGTDAQFVVTFNGGAARRGADALETMQFDARTNTFHFREISFPAAGAAPHVSADNPARCTACHGVPARPIWDTPPYWPGAYGERYGSGLSRTESAGMRAFLEESARGSRYGQLIDPARFAERTTYVAPSHARYGGEVTEPPNARFSLVLATLNVRSLVAALAQLPAFEAHRYALLQAAGGSCGATESFFPASTSELVRRSIGSYGHGAAAIGSGQDAAKRQRMTGATDGYRGGMHSADPVALRFIAERLVGLPPQRWSLALEGSTYDLAAPDGALTVEQLLFERIVATEPELRALRTYRTYTPSDAYCAELRHRSIRALSAYYAAYGAGPVGVAAAPVKADAASHPSALDRCIACHNGDVGPALPFSAPAALAPLLNQAGYAHGRLLDEILFRLTPEAGAARMPRGVNLTTQEERALADYFVLLAAQPPVDRQ